MVLNFIKDQNCTALNELQTYIKEFLRSIQREKDNNYARILHLANINTISLPQQGDDYIISKYEEVKRLLEEIKNTNNSYFNNLGKLMQDHIDNIHAKIEKILSIEIPRNENISTAVLQEICNKYNSYCNKKLKETEENIIKIIRLYTDKLDKTNGSIDELSNRSYSSHQHMQLSNDSRHILKNLKSRIQETLNHLKQEIYKANQDGELMLNTKQKEQKYINHIHLIQFMDEILHQVDNVERECLVFQNMIINSSKVLRDQISDIIEEITKIRTAIAEVENVYIE